MPIQQKPKKKWSCNMPAYYRENLIRYRTEAFGGSGERDAATVMAFETFELGNTDILETLSNGVLKDSKALRDRCLSFINELDDNGFVDDFSFDDGVSFYKEVLVEVEKQTGYKIKYALWLADKEVVTNRKWYGRDMVDDTDFESYVVGPVVLSDLGHDGTLYGYIHEPVSLEVQLEDLKDVLFDIVNEREGVRDSSGRAKRLDIRYLEVDNEIQELQDVLSQKTVTDLISEAVVKCEESNKGVSGKGIEMLRV